MRYAFFAAAAALLAGCPHHTNNTKPAHDDARAHAGDAAGSGGALPSDGPLAAVTLPPAPPIPLSPAGLPALPDSALLAAITPDQVALGELLFWDGRLGADGKTACASCHDPAHDYSGKVDVTAGGETNLRRTPSLANLAWAKEYAWDGRFTSLDDLMAAHIHGQLGQELDAAMAKLALLPAYAAHVARVGGTPGEAALRALDAYVLTRYAGDAPWDRMEAGVHVDPQKPAADPIVAGYVVFTGKGQCAVCHTPPLYSDFGYHVLDARFASRDIGRGKVVASQRGAFATPSLRGAAARAAFLHDGSATTLEQALDRHLAAASTAGAGAGAGSGAADAVAIDPALAKLALTADERAHVLAFVRALTATRPPPQQPVLP